jgi:hypothetical protein
MVATQCGEVGVYQSEFPVEQPVPVFDPTLLVGLILAALVIAGLAFAAGRLLGRRDRPGFDSQVPKVIHDAIKARCVAASSAPSGELLQKTQELIEEMEARIGPLLRFGGPCAKALAALRKALDEKAPPEPKPHKVEGDAHGHAAHKLEAKAHAHAESPAAKEGHPGHGTGCKCEACLVIAIGHAAPGLSIVGPRVGAQTVVITPPPAPPPPPPAPTPPPVAEKPADHGPDEPKMLSHKDYSRQVRMAVIDVSDFWSRGDCLKELQACQLALNATQPFPGGGGDWEGRRSGERAENRVHNRQAKPELSA